MERLNDNEGLRQSTLALGALAIGITAYELYCDDDELITYRVSELLKDKRTRLLTASFIGSTAMHLLGAMPKAIDPYHYVGKLRRFTRPDELPKDDIL